MDCQEFQKQMLDFLKRIAEAIEHIELEVTGSNKNPPKQPNNEGNSNATN